MDVPLFFGSDYRVTQQELTPGKGRRWVRFGLRALLVLILVCCIGLAWLAALMAEGRRQEQIATALSAAHCTVEMSHYKRVATKGNYGFQMDLVSTLNPALEWLGLGKAFRRIEHVTLRENSEMTPALAQLHTLDNLTMLGTYHSGITAEQLAELLDEIEVQKLYIPSVPLSRRELPWLNRPSLTWICVARTQFSNPAIDSLPLSLVYFDATRTRISDEGLDKFRRLTNLRMLKLRRTQASLAAVQGLRKKMPWCVIEWQDIQGRSGVSYGVD
ncbi:hypothetical protein DSM3645_16485 [Blastopirellula marina DSM 3645]|uniref:Leucine Rich repeats (2 copies) n=1 Tax=Blastopirellula marina DSM 3645 TaxID=314230 RepID=A3ZN75_9BACT|nr:hypothetical protein DSM3645_16485 [Blastopirellula marina DSM 3645]